MFNHDYLWELEEPQDDREPYADEDALEALADAANELEYA